MKNENVEMKICKSCKQNKSLKSYQTDNNSKDGKWKLCPECESFRQKQNHKQTEVLIQMICDKPTGFSNIFITKRRFKLWLKSLNKNINPDRVTCFSKKIKNGQITIGNYTPISKEINAISIGVKNILRKYKNEKEVIDQILATISHESIHHLLYINQNENTTKQYDNIYKNIRMHGIVA